MTAESAVPCDREARQVELVEAFAQFGSDWWYVAAPLAVAAAVATALVRASTSPAAERLVLRFADGAGRVTGWPDWAAATFVVALGAMLIAFSGFFWDVAWHISIGRDEFLLSPPHVHLLLGTTGVGVAGAVGVHVATRTDAAVGWQVRRWRMPFGCAGLLAMGVLAICGYWVDEFWHSIYGLDVTMWSPPHMLMIGSVMFAPVAVWLVLAEGGRRPTAVTDAAAGRARPPHWELLQHRALAALSAGAVLVGVSATQFEYDLAVSVWPQAAQVVLIALAAGVALPLVRVALGRGGALAAVAVFVVLRGAAAVLTAGVWSLEVPRFPLYLAAAVAVEVAFLVTRGRTWTTRALAAGGAVGTFGLAGEWLWMQVWGYHPWGAGPWPEVLLGTAAAIAIAPIGVATGRVLAHRPIAIPGRVAAAGALVALVAVAPTLVRDTADVSARVTSEVVATAADGRSLIDVTVAVRPTDAAVDADRFEVFQWQGGERTIRPLQPTGEPGVYRTGEPAPMGGARKTMVLLASGSQLGAVPIQLPADPEIGASEIAFEPVREQALVPQTDLFLREAVEGAPTWPGYLAGVVIVVAIGGTVAALTAGVVGLDRRRAGATLPPGGPDRQRHSGDPAVATAGAATEGTGRDHHEVTIVGSGFAGLGMAAQLREVGITDVVLLERGDDVGGTWRDNSYPGAACDVPSNLYSFSFAPNPAWSRSFSPQGEILDYLRRVADDHGIRPRVRFGETVVDARFDEAAARWVVRTDGGRTYTSRFLISATGPLSEPVVPDLPGLDTFPGTVFHSARWDHDHDLTGERVAVVGTGASAIQFVPQVAPVAGHTTIFQRTPAWIAPRLDRRFTRVERWLFRYVPVVQRLARALVYWNREAMVAGLAKRRSLLRPVQAVAAAHLRRQVRDPQLRRDLTPSYTIGCKRILISNDYYPALQRDDVELVPSGVREVRGATVVAADGTAREVDTIVFGTGFEVSEPPFARHVRGRDGRLLSDVWADGMRAHLGTSVPGFPNLFLLIGPNTGLGHTSMVFMMEAQMRYLVHAITTIRAAGVPAVEVRDDVLASYDAEVQQRLAGTVWTTGGCSSWYLDASGRNSTLWPDFTFRFRRRTKRFHLDEHEVVHPPGGAVDAPQPEGERIPA